MSSDEVNPIQKDDAMQQPTETDAGSSSTPESSDKTGRKIIDLFSRNQETIWKPQAMQNRVRDVGKTILFSHYFTSSEDWGFQVAKSDPGNTFVERR